MKFQTKATLSLATSFVILGSFSVNAVEEGTTDILIPKPTVAVVMSSLQPSGMDDKSITANINKRYLIDPRINSSNILVSTENGVVTLSGTANSIEQASAAIEIAGSTQGVLDINTTHLTVGGVAQPQFADTIITSRLRGVYVREKVYQESAPANVNIETKDGVVYITGTVENAEQARQVMELAKAIPNVKRVESKVSIKSGNQ